MQQQSTLRSGNPGREMAREEGRSLHPGRAESLHPNWQRLIRLCASRRHLTLTLNIADGLPVSADQAVEKIRFDCD